ncbi:MAG: aminopeptidase [Solirubrobacteraceae bacterium]
MNADTATTIAALAQLVVGLGANVQPGQIVAVSSEPGKEPLARAIADAAYARGAKFVDVSVFDAHVKRARLRHADPRTLTFVPSWYGERIKRLGEERAALIAMTGPVAPGLMDTVDPALLGMDLLPRLRETSALVEERLVNWSAVPCPTGGWAERVHPELAAGEALERLWEEIAHICRLRETDPVASWNARLDRLTEMASALSALALDSLRFEGPDTNLTIGLLGSSRWIAARLQTVEGIVHVPNLPTEEVFTAPDPARVEGTVASTKPLFVSGVVVTGLRVRFEGGRAVAIDADQGAGTVRALITRDAGAARLGEVALVDRESRIGALGTVFYDTLIDENAAGHIALGQGYGISVQNASDLERLNRSEIHVDFMIGSDDVSVTGFTAGGDQVPLLRGGVWQI